MQVCMLLTDELKPVPDAVKVVQNWGDVCLTSGVYGDHVIVECEEQALRDWLSPFDGFWKAKPGTAVMAQEFEAVHIEP